MFVVSTLFTFATFVAVTFGRPGGLRFVDSAERGLSPLAVTPVSDPWNAKANPPADIASFEFRLYQSSDYSAGYSVKNIHRRPLETVNVFPTAQQNWANVIAYNIPVGYVLTLVQDNVLTGSSFSGTDYDFENQIRAFSSIDLLGTGKPEAKVLTGALARTTNCWALYKYDTTLGYVEFYSQANFQGERMLLFPSRFAPQTLTKMRGDTNVWYHANRIRSIRWTNLDSTVFFSLYRNYDGSGLKFNEVTGRTFSVEDAKSITDLTIYRGFKVVNSYTTGILAFSWDFFTPLSITVLPLPVPDANVKTKRRALQKSVLVENKDGQSLEVNVGLDQSWTKTSSVTVGTEVTKSWSYSVTFGVEYGNDMSACKASLEVSRTQSQDSTRSTDNTQEKSETLDVSEQHTVSITDPGRFLVTASIDLADVTPVTLAFPVIKVYDFEVAGGVSMGNGLWNRTENLYASVAGSFRSDSKLTVVKLP